MIPELVSNLCDILLAVNGASIKEDHRVLRILNTECRDEKTLQKINNLNTELVSNAIGKCLVSGEIIGEVEINDAKLKDLQDETIQFVIRKDIQHNRLCFFTLQSLENFLSDGNVISMTELIWIASDFKGFASWSTWYLPWGDEPPYQLDEWKGLDNPKRLVRDLTRTQMVPATIKPWLLYPHISIETSDVLEIWKREASKHLKWVLPKEIEEIDGQTVACVRGDRQKKCSINQEETDWLNLFDPLSECASWVYGVIQEADSKHVLLNHHLAVETKYGHPWPDKLALENALTNAKEAYSLHLIDSSKEALNSLAAIKKTLNEEVGQVVQNTHKLSTNLWRDFIIVISAIVIRFTVDSRNLPEFAVSLVGSVIILFIITNFLTTTCLNYRFARIAKRNRESWRKKVYQFLDKEGYYDLVTKPITEAQKEYSKAVLITAFLYIFIVAILCFLLYAKIDVVPKLVSEMFV